MFHNIALTPLCTFFLIPLTNGANRYLHKFKIAERTERTENHLRNLDKNDFKQIICFCDRITLNLQQQLAVLSQGGRLYQVSDGLSNDYDAGVYPVYGILQLSLVIDEPLCVLDHKQNYRPINRNRGDID